MKREWSQTTLSDVVGTLKQPKNTKKTENPPKIISGGQTGVDICALRAAKRANIETGGWAPFGYITIKGPQKELLQSFCLFFGFILKILLAVVGYNLKNILAPTLVRAGI